MRGPLRARAGRLPDARHRRADPPRRRHRPAHARDRAGGARRKALVPLPRRGPQEDPRAPPDRRDPAREAELVPPHPHAAGRARALRRLPRERAGGGGGGRRVVQDGAPLRGRPTERGRRARRARAAGAGAVRGARRRATPHRSGPRGERVAHRDAGPRRRHRPGGGGPRARPQRVLRGRSARRRAARPPRRVRPGGRRRRPAARSLRPARLLAGRPHGPARGRVQVLARLPGEPRRRPGGPPAPARRGGMRTSACRSARTGGRSAP